jgi:hypothetical protein
MTLALATTWQQVITWVIGAVLVGAAWLAMEGAGDIAEEVTDPSQNDAKWSSVRLRVIATYFIIIAVAFGVFLLARWLLKSAT